MSQPAYLADKQFSKRRLVVHYKDPVQTGRNVFRAMQVFHPIIPVVPISEWDHRNSAIRIGIRNYAFGTTSSEVRFRNYVVPISEWDHRDSAIRIGIRNYVEFGIMSLLDSICTRWASNALPPGC
jgi:hypothetical protein